MEQRRRNGLIAMATGLAVAVVGELVAHWWVLTAIVAVVATAGLIGGGVVVALTYREETGRVSTSRLSLLTSRASSKSLARSRDVGDGLADVPEDTGAVVVYAAQFNDQLARCESLLRAEPMAAGGPGHDLLDARDRLMTFVANPMYGAATRRKLVDESRVRDVSTRLAAVL